VLNTIFADLRIGVPSAGILIRHSPEIERPRREGHVETLIVYPKKERKSFNDKFMSYFFNYTFRLPKITLRIQTFNSNSDFHIKKIYFILVDMLTTGWFRVLNYLLTNYFHTYLINFGNLFFFQLFSKMLILIN